MIDTVDIKATQLTGSNFITQSRTKAAARQRLFLSSVISLGGAC